jgi:DNA (cytosine-5)-methyltransferase 1
MSQWNMSYRKLEWQAGNANSLDECVVQFRPSGLRIKKATYLPALVAITQTPYLVKHSRHLSVREAARLQGFPDSFIFRNQSDAASFKQLGNAVCVGAVAYVYEQLKRQAEAIALSD